MAVLCLLSSFGYSQNYNIEPQLISSMGGVSPDSELHSSLGESFVATLSDLSNDDIKITSGFYQNSSLLTSIGPEPIAVELSFYPNPSSDIVNVHSSEGYELSVTVLGANGQLLSTKHISNNDSQVSLAEYPDGVYYLRLTNEDAMVNIYKVFKIQ